MATYFEALESSKSHSYRGVRWTPCDGNDPCPCSGRLTIIQGKRDAGTTYAVTEFPTPMGRGFKLVKADEDEAYGVLLASEGREHDLCECRGFERHHHCKHIDAVRAITVENNWLADPRGNPEQDTGATELTDQLGLPPVPELPPLPAPVRYDHDLTKPGKPHFPGFVNSPELDAF